MGFSSAEQAHSCFNMFQPISTVLIFIWYTNNSYVDFPFKCTYMWKRTPPNENRTTTKHQRKVNTMKIIQWDGRIPPEIHMTKHFNFISLCLWFDFVQILRVRVCVYWIGSWRARDILLWNSFLFPKMRRNLSNKQSK